MAKFDVSWWIEDCVGNSLHYASDRLAGSREIDLKDISGYVGQIDSVLDRGPPMWRRPSAECNPGSTEHQFRESLPAGIAGTGLLQ